MEYSVKINNDKLEVTFPDGQTVNGFIENGNYGAKSRAVYVKLRKADKAINLTKMIKENAK